MSYWFWTIIFLISAFNSYSSEANKHHKKTSAVVVVGTVYCDTCFQQDIPKASHFIAGATVAVECKNTTTSSRPTFRQEVQTDNHGQFKVHLPFPVSKHVKKIKGCSVKLITSNKPYCSIAATATSSNLHLRSRRQGIHIFSAGFFTFRPFKKPTVCDQKPTTNNNIKKLNTEKLSSLSNPNDPTFPPPIQDPQPSEPPALGRLLPPLPDLPRLPPLPGIPFLPPKPTKETELSDNNNNAVNQPDSFPFPPNPFNPPNIFPPNPFQPPPSLLPPNPLQPPPSLIPPVFPSPPPSIFPPIFPSPPSPPFFPLPPIPGLTPSPPPPPPVFPIPLPPFPFQPSPGFPGVPPAEVSSKAKTSSP